MRRIYECVILVVVGLTGVSPAFADCKNGQCDTKEPKPAVVKVDVGPLHIQVGGKKDGHKKHKHHKCDCKGCKCKGCK